MLDWDKLRIFHQVAKAGSFTAAADEMNLSQSALSRQVITLESRLGVPVFERLRKGLKLTKEGAVLYEQVEKMVAHAEFAQRFIKDQELEAEGTLTVMTTHTLTHWLMRYLPDFLDQYPNINFHFESDDRLSFDSSIDILISPYQENRPDLVQIPIHKIKMGLFASQAYLDKHGTPKTVRDLDDHKLMIIKSKSGSIAYTDWILKIGREGEPRIPYITGDSTSHMLLKAAEAGLGIAQFGTKFPETENVDLVQILPDLDAPTVELYYCYSKDKERYKSIRLFGKYLTEADLSII